MRAVRPIIAAATLLTLAVIIVRGLDQEPRLAGTNLLEASDPAVVLRDGERHCQRDFLPADTDRVQLYFTAPADRPVPPIDVTLTETNGRLIAQNRAPESSPGSAGEVPLPLGRTVTKALPLAQLCVRPRGGKITLGGFTDIARVEWLRPGSESHLGLIGTISHRFGLGKTTWIGAWTFWVAIALIVLVWALVARLMLREARDS